MKTNVTYVALPSGDNALVVNRKLCGTADPMFREPDLKPLAEKLAKSLDADLHDKLLTVGDEEEWTWEEVLADNKIIDPVSAQSFDKKEWLNTTRGECVHCGRDYRDNPLKPGEPCIDDCPTNWELVGKVHPDHPNG